MIGSSASSGELLYTSSAQRLVALPAVQSFVAWLHSKAARLRPLLSIMRSILAWPV
jgi:hypothetical protein